MTTRNQLAIPAALERTRRRFEQWRRTRRVRTPIPDPLWAAAVKMAQTYGIHRTAKTLRVHYGALKRRIDKKPGSTRQIPRRRAAATFIELPPAPPMSAGFGQCVVELQDAQGAKMRIHWKGVAAPDLEALSRSFWRAPS